MNLTATLSNALWNRANLPSYLRFRRSLKQPERVQAALLAGYLSRNANTTFGQQHGFVSIKDYADFVHRVPLLDYHDLEPWIDRIRTGETNLLTSERITRLVPTSGSSGARKLIPFTAGLQREFNAAIGPWMIDLFRRTPGMAGGPAYWSVTPAMDSGDKEQSMVPIGFDSDTAYLGGARQKLVSAIMAVPHELRLVRDLSVFRYVTLLCLLHQRDLRLASIWHPSFLRLLLDALPAIWDNLLGDVASGSCRFQDALPPALRMALTFRPNPSRANELKAADPKRPETLWPKLKLISCWGDASAALAAGELKSLFPHTHIQAKGLLATEAIVTIPYAGAQPVALRSHFFEFIDSSGAVLRLHELQMGQTYEVVVTTAGGLWRYRMGDSVKVTGFVGKTPSLTFLGRVGNVSDLFGEKLSEAFVTQAIQEAMASLHACTAFALLAPDEDTTGIRYTLYVEGTPPAHLADSLDDALRKNPHYAYCRKLGQLQHPRIYIIAENGYEDFVQHQSSVITSMGNVKPAALSKKSNWSAVFRGAYFPVS